MKDKKSVIGPVISVFVMVLVISILAGLIFLFTAELKDNVYDQSSTETVTVTNESGWINGTGYYLSRYDVLGFSSPSITSVYNATDPVAVESGNYSVSSAGLVTNLTGDTWNGANFTYTYVAIQSPTAYSSVNDTEEAGADVVSYLSLIFLALIFGAILTIVLKIILPYVNLGQKVGGF